MEAAPDFGEHPEHGEHCGCRLLALAIGMDPGKLSYAYCVNVLQKRWRLTCNHDELNSNLAANCLVLRS